jgi:adenosylcobinamide-phosphate synthase
MRRPKSHLLSAAVLLDVLWGDPPNRYHPTAWMGTLIGRVKQWALSRQTPQQQLLTGALLTMLGSISVHRIVSCAQKYAGQFSTKAAALLEIFLLKSTFTYRGLERTSKQVEAALDKQALQEARTLVSYHLVSRDTSNLDESQLAAAAIESVAENASDSLLAPLFYYAAGGLPAAVVYRFVNTADAMLGYKDPTHFWLGKIPARIDDLLNLIPARLTGLLISLASWLKGDRQGQAFKIMRRDAGRTESPNAGYPMSAMSGALSVKLEKAGQYRLGADFPAPRREDLSRARKLFRLTAFLGVGLMLFLITSKVKRGQRKK